MPAGQSDGTAQIWTSPVAHVGVAPDAPPSPPPSEPASDGGAPPSGTSQTIPVPSVDLMSPVGQPATWAGALAAWRQHATAPVMPFAAQSAVCSHSIIRPPLAGLVQAVPQVEHC